MNSFMGSSSWRARECTVNLIEHTMVADVCLPPVPQGEL